MYQIDEEATENNVVVYDYLAGEETILSSEKHSSLSQTNSLERISPAYTVGEEAVSPSSILGGTDTRVKVNPSKSPYSRVILMRMVFDTTGDGRKSRIESKNCLVMNTMIMTWVSLPDGKPCEGRVLLKSFHVQIPLLENV